MAKSKANGSTRPHRTARAAVKEFLLGLSRKSVKHEDKRLKEKHKESKSGLTVVPGTMFTVGQIESVVDDCVMKTHTPGMGTGGVKPYVFVRSTKLRDGLGFSGTDVFCLLALLEDFFGISLKTTKESLENTKTLLDVDCLVISELTRMGYKVIT